MFLLNCSCRFFVVVFTYFGVHKTVVFCAEQCEPKFYGRNDVAVNLNSCNLVDLSQQMESAICAAQCDNDANCTAVAAETRSTTTWCCFFDSNKPILYKFGGSLSLYLEKRDQAKLCSDDCRLCEFGHEEMANCRQCVQNGKWKGTYFLNVPGTLDFTFDFAAEGENCSSFTGRRHVGNGGKNVDDGVVTDTVGWKINLGWIFAGNYYNDWGINGTLGPEDGEKGTFELQYQGNN